MSPSTTEFALPYPSGTDDADVPSDMQALADRIEDLLQGSLKLFAPGDIKFSAQPSDHGRWLKMNDRWLSAAQIESALSLPAGQAADLVALLGTGAVSKYWVGAGSPGSSVSSKIYLPEARRKIPIGAGPSSDGPGSLTVRDLGGTGGAETVTLTGAQSGLKGHTHTATQAAHSHSVTDPGHAHTISVTAAGGHSHGTGSLAVASGGTHTHDLTGAGVTAAVTAAGGHTHGAGTLAADSSGTLTTASNGTHTHGDTFAVATDGEHAHSSITTFTDASPLHKRDIGFEGVGAGAFGISDIVVGADRLITSVDGDHSHALTGSIGSAGAHTHTIPGHTHTVSGTTGAVADHTHTLSGATASNGAHTHSVSGSTGSVADHTHAASAASSTTGISLGNSTPSITVNSASAADASNSHENMPPFVTLGYAFIRV